jgi:cobalt/nickel transport system permease protein
MHITEGVLAAPVLISGAAVAAAGTAVGLGKITSEKVPQVGVMAAVFFVASLIHVPVGASSAHLILNGLAGLLLGWAVFPALLVGLFLQGVLFGFGGLTTLGVNTTTMALPGLVCYLAFGTLLRRGPALSGVAAFSAGALSVLLAGVLVAVALTLSGDAFASAAKAIILVHLPIAAIEGTICVLCVAFLRKVKPQLLPGRENGDRHLF